MFLDVFYRNTGLDKVVPKISEKYPRNDAEREIMLRQSVRIFIDLLNDQKKLHSVYVNGKLDGYIELDEMYLGSNGDDPTAEPIASQMNLYTLVENIWVELFGHCSCGRPGDMCLMVAKKCKSMWEDFHKEWDAKKDAYYRTDDYMLYELDRVGFSEHGGSVCGSWISDLGVAFVILCESVDTDDISAELRKFGDHVPDADGNCEETDEK